MNESIQQAPNAYGPTLSASLFSLVSSEWWEGASAVVLVLAWVHTHCGLYCPLPGLQFLHLQSGSRLILGARTMQCRNPGPAQVTGQKHMPLKDDPRAPILTYFPSSCLFPFYHLSETGCQGQDGPGLRDSQSEGRHSSGSESGGGNTRPHLQRRAR